MARKRPSLVLAIAVITAACTARSPVSPIGLTRPPAREVASNVLRRDYAGSNACAPCHHDIVDRWRASPMHNMTRMAAAAVIQAPFSGTALRFKDDRVDLETKDGERWVHVRSVRFGDADYRVTRVIGGHHREDYVGVDARHGGDELVLPVSYLLWSKKFRYKGYSVMSRERPGVTAGPEWTHTCIFCHNTEPYFSDMLGGLVDRRAGFQGELVDDLLPSSERSHVVVDDARALDADLLDEVEHLTHDRPAASDGLPWVAIHATRDHFRGGDLVEVGIGCESCHGGSAEHVRDPTVRTSLAPHTAAFHFTGMEEEASRINRTCARCHQVLFSRYPWTWEGGRRDQDPGGSNINSGEARDFLLGACSRRATCTLCHDPHAPDNHERAARLETPAGDAICTQCHTSLASAPAARVHTHHDPSGPGGRCIACHMPKKNMALDLTLGRYHRIGSPNDRDKMLDRPFECALCHGDKTVGAIAKEMEQWWGKRIDPAVLEGLYGSADANVLDATLARGKPHEQAVAIALLGERKDRTRARAVAAQLTNEYPLVRFYAERALEAMSGETSTLDMYAPDDELAAAGQAWAARIAR